MMQFFNTVKFFVDRLARPPIRDFGSDDDEEAEEQRQQEEERRRQLLQQQLQKAEQRKRCFSCFVFLLQSYKISVNYNASSDNTK